MAESIQGMSMTNNEENNTQVSHEVTPPSSESNDRPSHNVSPPSIVVEEPEVPQVDIW